MTIPPSCRVAARIAVALVVIVCAGACGDDPPTGVSRSDLQGLWTGDLDNASLMGRTLSGSVDWIFNANTFELRFFDTPVGQAERISGSWKFSDGRLILTLTSSFPIGDDIGATDSLFVSILGNELSMQTQAGSSILLRLSARSTVMRPAALPADFLAVDRFWRARPPFRYIARTPGRSGPA